VNLNEKMNIFELNDCSKVSDVSDKILLACTALLHAPSCTIMHPSCSPPLLWNAIKRLNKMSLDGSTAATSKTAGQMRTPSWHM